MLIIRKTQYRDTWVQKRPHPDLTGLRFFQEESPNVTPPVCHSAISSPIWPSTEGKYVIEEAQTAALIEPVVGSDSRQDPPTMPVTPGSLTEAWRYSFRLISRPMDWGGPTLNGPATAKKSEITVKSLPDTTTAYRQMDSGKHTNHHSEGKMPGKWNVAIPSLFRVSRITRPSKYVEVGRPSLGVPCDVLSLLLQTKSPEIHRGFRAAAPIVHDATDHPTRMNPHRPMSWKRHFERKHRQNRQTSSRRALASVPIHGLAEPRATLREDVGVNSRESQTIAGVSQPDLPRRHKVCPCSERKCTSWQGMDGFTDERPDGSRRRFRLPLGMNLWLIFFGGHGAHPHACHLVSSPFFGQHRFCFGGQAAWVPLTWNVSAVNLISLCYISLSLSGEW
ncbi:hypothetical protein CCUS01_10242 [Colletotrichum cuscutae]|uniref:Uncharacterized protein n=1 Tax=Colletotrichum cuscutae TaxID=1209917 RepID=A0AAI9XQ27_9PEZI|nr:hypothetical protein CCUS01_10242 [Colletotrichum cuscutae]